MTHSDGAQRGSRTWDRPEGDGSKEFEVTGNAHASLTCETCDILHAEGKEFLIESSWPSGRYPEIWGQPAMVALRRKTGALIVPMHMCAWVRRPRATPIGGTAKAAGGWCPRGYTCTLCPWRVGAQAPATMSS